jgi:hypothetical protein
VAETAAHCNRAMGNSSSSTATHAVEASISKKIKMFDSGPLLTGAMAHCTWVRKLGKELLCYAPAIAMAIMITTADCTIIVVDVALPSLRADRAASPTGRPGGRGDEVRRNAWNEAVAYMVSGPWRPTPEGGVQGSC